jgi:hypothetical protein
MILTDSSRDTTFVNQSSRRQMIRIIQVSQSRLMTWQVDRRIVDICPVILKGFFASKTHLESPMALIPSIEVDSVMDSLATSPTATPAPSQISILSSKRTEERRIDGVIWSSMPEPQNIYRKSYKSRVWEHGAAYQRTEKP